jgi:predicted amidohydrolase YtcJ
LEADLALTGGKVVTMDGEESIAEAVAVKYGRIIKVGSSSDVKPLIDEGTRLIDLQGRTVVPGFIDSHCHMMRTGADRMIKVDLSEEAGVHSIADLVEGLKERAQETLVGEWVVGYQEDDSKLTEKRHPTRWDLDEASTEHPIIISTVGGHFYVANSLAFEKAGVSKDTPDPVGSGSIQGHPRPRGGQVRSGSGDR